MKQGSFPPAGLCCPEPSAGTTTPSDSLAAARHFPVVAGYRRALLPEPAARGRGGPLQFPRHPSDRSTPPTPEGSLAPAPGSQVPSMAFASGIQARLPLGPLTRGFLTTLQASLDAADRSVARPAAGRSSSASTPGSRPTPGVLLPGTLASPQAGLTPAGCRELVARLRRGTPPFGGPRRPSYWTHIPEESAVRRRAGGRRQAPASLPRAGRSGNEPEPGPSASAREQPTGALCESVSESSGPSPTSP
jgi:hypothetical protein